MVDSVKAFMSTDSERHVPPYPEHECPLCVGVALDEARAILAERGEGRERSLSVIGSTDGAAALALRAALAGFCS